MIRVAIVDDHPHVAIALRTLLDRTSDLRLVAEARRGGEVMSLVRQSQPDVLLLDLFLEPEFDARAAVRSLRADFPEVKICIISAHLEPAWIRELLQAGVYGYILKDDDYVSHIDDILHDLAGGRITSARRLTKRWRRPPAEANRIGRSRSGRSKSCAWPSAVCPTRRSRSRCTFPQGRCATISARSTPSSESTAATRRSRLPPSVT